jgi:hypothetical protein
MRTFLSIAVIYSFAYSMAMADDGFTPLFDGKSLDGWSFVVKPDKDGKKADPKLTWSAKDGVLHCTGKPNGCIVTQKEYADYTLKLKWRWPGTPGNSGVLLHVQDEKYWPTSIEAQLLSGRAGDFLLNNPPDAKLEVEKARHDPKLERRFLRIEPKDAVEKKAGEWNACEITCRGDTITFVVNGVMVNEGTKCSFKSGRIALQSEGAEVEFKEIVLKPLK